MTIRLVRAAVFFALLGASQVAFADTKECIAAFDQGQHSKTDHHLRQAETQLLACTKETCPAVLRADCADVLKSVQSALPSVVLAAQDGGKDVTDVKVFNGTELVAASLDGKSIDLDPGEYDLRFEHGQNLPTTVHFALREGEKNREVKGIFNPPKPVPLVMLPPEREPRSTVGYIVPGAFVLGGVAAFIVAVVERKTFDNDVAEFQTGPNHCAPNCTQASRAALSDTLVHANISLGIGIGALAVAAATWFILTPGYKPQRTPTTAVLTW